jgi:uncharacterized protein YjbI with pentapeptide repeats
VAQVIDIKNSEASLDRDINCKEKFGASATPKSVKTFSDAFILSKVRLAPCVELSKSRWVGEEIRDRDLRWASFRESRLIKLKCKNSDFRGADFRGAQAAQSQWSRCRLESANFEGAKLSRSDFRNIDLQHAKFGYAFISYADFRGADLRSTDFRNSILIGAQFENAKYDLNTKLPFSAADAARKGMILVPKNDQRTPSEEIRH